MKKMKLALIALGSVIGIGGAVAATTQSPGQYFSTQTGGTAIAGQKGVDWDCDSAPLVTCAYLEQPNGSRTKITGHRIEP